MESASDDIIQDDEFWKEHILKAKRSGVSVAEYCRANNLSEGLFYTRKRRLGLMKPARRKRPAFVRVEPVAEAPIKGKSFWARQLPEPEWAAKFVMALMGDNENHF